MPFLPPNQQRQSTEGNHLTTRQLTLTIGDRSYWAGWATAHPLLAPVGRRYLWPAHIWAALNITYYVIAVLHSHSDVWTFHGHRKWCHGLWIGTHTTCVDGLWSQKNFCASAFKILVGPWCCLTKLTIYLAHPLFTHPLHLPLMLFILLLHCWKYTYCSCCQILRM